MPETQAPRVIAIGDVHGCAAALATLIEAIQPQAADTIVGLGDYINRGPDTKSVLNQLLELRRRCKLVPLMGNHEVLLLRAGDNPRSFEKFLSSGGGATLDSYGPGQHRRLFPADHLSFVGNCAFYYETDTHFFVHGNYDPALPISQQDKRISLWLSLRDKVPGPHSSGKIAVVGHTPQPDCKILDLGYLKCLDTGCCRGNCLSAMDVTTGQLWQSEPNGKLRKQKHAG